MMPARRESPSACAVQLTTGVFPYLCHGDSISEKLHELCLRTIPGWEREDRGRIHLLTLASHCQGCALPMSPDHAFVPVGTS